MYTWFWQCVRWSSRLGSRLDCYAEAEVKITSMARVIRWCKGRREAKLDLERRLDTRKRVVHAA
jgi:hypothetical protein